MKGRDSLACLSVRYRVPSTEAANTAYRLDLRRRCRHDGGRAPQPPVRRGVGQLLLAPPVARGRRRRQRVRRARDRRRPGRQPGARGRRCGAVGRRHCQPPRAGVRELAVALFRPARARGRPLIPIENDEPAQPRHGLFVQRRCGLAFEVFHLPDAKDSDIDYFYTSRLPGEPAGGVDESHFHPVLPRTARVSLMIGFWHERAFRIDHPLRTSFSRPTAPAATWWLT